MISSGLQKNFIFVHNCTHMHTHRSTHEHKHTELFFPGWPLTCHSETGETNNPCCWTARGCRSTKSTSQGSSPCLHMPEGPTRAQSRSRSRSKSLEPQTTAPRCPVESLAQGVAQCLQLRLAQTDQVPGAKPTLNRYRVQINTEWPGTQRQWIKTVSWCEHKPLSSDVLWSLWISVISFLLCQGYSGPRSKHTGDTTTTTGTNSKK